MNAIRSIIAVACLLTTSVVHAQGRAVDAPVLLQAAVHQETVNGNLDSAITLYRRVAGDRRADRATIARALVGLGRAHEALGQAEAQRAYARVVNEFGDQLEQVAYSRQRLAALTQSDAKSVTAGGLSLRRVWHDPGVDMEGQPTPDGKLLTFVDWETGHLAVRDVATGTKRNISKAGYPGYALGSSVSRDGRQVAYFWTDGERQRWQPQLRVVGIDGSNERILIENADKDINYLTPYEWTPDGGQVLVVIQRRAGIELALVDGRTGAIRTIKSLDWRTVMRASLSPDGRWIAYDVQTEREKPERDVMILAADGSAEHRLTEHPANDLHAVWMSNEELVFASRRGGSIGLWRARVKLGRAQYEPELVKADMTPGFYPMGVTANGKLFYSQDTGGGDIYTVGFDLSEARVAGEPTKLPLRYQGLNAAAHFSPTGDAMLYTSRRDALSIGHSLGVYLHDLKSGSERHLNVYTVRPFAQPRISPDGKQAILWSRSIRGGEQIILVDLASATRKTLLSEPQAILGNPQWSRDGKSIYYFRNNDTLPMSPRLVKRVIATGQEEVVHRFDLFSARWTWAISPDETVIAYAGTERGSQDYRLRVAPLGGQSRELARVPAPQAISDRTGITWTPDGTNILYGIVPDRRWVGDPNVTLYGVAASGGTPHEVGLRLHELRYVSFLPDGKTLAFTAGPNVFNEVWIMENLRTASSR